MNNEPLLIGDCLESLQMLPDNSAHCCVTSPPYFGLRDYGHDGQIGLEPTPDEFVAALVVVFREVRRVLRDDGTLWLNLGDTYASGGRKTRDTDEKLPQRGADFRAQDGLPEKNPIGIPWRVAFALQSDGWILRQDIVWHKPNPMPESVTDRCTKAHEYIFLLSKSPRYYFDHEAIKEPAVGGAAGNKTRKPATERGCPKEGVASGVPWAGSETRNRRSVWSVPTRPFKGAHFATFPPDLIEPCILAGCPEGGTVLDPFMGAGTTALVAERHGREWIGCELNSSYAELAVARLVAARASSASS